MLNSPTFSEEEVFFFPTTVLGIEKFNSIRDIKDVFTALYEKQTQGKKKNWFLKFTMKNLLKYESSALTVTCSICLSRVYYLIKVNLNNEKEYILK